MGGDVLGVEVAHAVEVDAERPGPAPARRAHLDCCPRRLPDAPERGGAAVAQHGAWAAGEDGSQPTAFAGQCRVTYGIDATVHAVESPGLDAPRDRVVTEGEGFELRDRDDPVLPRCQSSDLSVPAGGWAV